MSKVVHTSRIRIVRERGPTRKAMIEGFDEPIYYGVHGGIKQFYKVEPEKEYNGKNSCIPITNVEEGMDRRFPGGSTA